MIDKLFLAWRNPGNRSWLPIGILEYKNDMYYFQYTKGAKVQNFQTFGQMTDLNKTYTSDVLFPLFKNRLLSKSRPEYEDFLNWLDINSKEGNDLLELARSGGIRATDELQLFPMPEKNKDGEYEALFFAHGLSHISKNYMERLSQLVKGEKLLLLKDIQNTFDPSALVLRSVHDPVELLGFCPAFFIQDFNKLIDINGSTNVNIFVQKVNMDAPSQLKLLCKYVTKWPDSFNAFQDEEYQPFNDSESDNKN